MSTLLHAQEQRWHGDKRASTTQNRRTKDPNRIKSRPADPEVISSILSSFEALDPLTSLDTREYHTPEGSLRALSHARTNTDESLATGPSVPFINAAPSVQTSDRHTCHDNALGTESDDDEDYDAALPPTIATTRSLSAMSIHSTHYNNTIGGTFLRPASIASRRSSIGSAHQERHSISRKLSADSWLKQNIQSSVGAAQAMRNLGRIDSQESLQNAEVDLGAMAYSPREYTSSSISDWEDIRNGSAHALPITRGRLFLDSDGLSMSSTEESSPISPTESERMDIARRTEKERSPSPKRASSPLPSPKTILAVQTSAKPSASLAVQTPMKHLPIADSIPMRTSSLRQSSSVPPRTKRPSSSLKQKSSDRVVKLSKMESIPDTSWADLGEDDETVKRILELRKKRETRLLEVDVQLFEEPFSAPTSPLIDRKVEIKAESDARNPRPTTGRSGTDPSGRKARALLGLDVPGANRVTLKPTSTRAARKSPPPELIQTTRSNPAPERPHSAGSVTSPISLEYSYLRAVKAMQREDLSPTKNLVQGTATKSTTQLQRPSLAVKRPASQGGSRPSSRGRQSFSQNRRANLHPDVPLDYDKKRNRRKSDGQDVQDRRDSVEDAVLLYLSAPRFSQRVSHPAKGRTISFSEVGDPAGSAVFICVGMGLTRYVTAFYDELATTLGLRLLTLERPGVGNSSPLAPSDKSGPLNWPDEVLAVCAHLGIARFSLLAHSAGAVYALATALRLPHMVKGKVHLLAPWIPPSQLANLNSTDPTSPGALPRSQRLLRVLPTPLLRAVNSSFMTAAASSLKPIEKRKPSNSQDHSAYQSASRRPTLAGNSASNERPEFARRESMMLMDHFMPSSNPMESFLIPLKSNGASISEEHDAPRSNSAVYLTATATPSDPEFDFAATGLNAAEHAERERQSEFTSQLTQRTWEYAIRDSNPATDLLVCLERNREVGFRYTDVSRPVIITHGAEDKRVPVGNVRWLGEQMNRVALAGPRVHSLSAMQSQEAVASQLELSRAGAGGCEVRVLPGEGHGLMASPTIMGDILTEIAGYWRETPLY